MDLTVFSTKIMILKRVYARCRWYYRIGLLCTFLLACLILSWSHSKILSAKSAAFKSMTDTKLKNPVNSQNTESKKQNELEKALSQAQEKQYTILMWERPFGNRFVFKYYRKSECGNCVIVFDNKTKADDPDTKAIVFHFKETNINNIPKHRRADQLYVWFAMESSPAVRDAHHLSLTEYDRFFNLTATPRRDSDIYWPYKSAERMWNSAAEASENTLQYINENIFNKTRLAIWIVSNCFATDGAVKRWRMVDKLVGAGLQLDRRGRCFPEYGEVTDMKTIRKYKFYFAFENGHHCKDYITEKPFTNGFSMGAVPVVWGAKKSDYEILLPPNSFIFVEDFQTPTELVKYLNYLDKNITAYKEYFLWRTKKVAEMPQYGRQWGACQLCRIINGINVDNIFNTNYEKLRTNIPTFGHSKIPRIVPSLAEWFYDTEDKDCLSNS